MNDLTPPARMPKRTRGDATSMVDAELDASTGEEMDATGHPGHMPSADRHCQRNRALRRERKPCTTGIWQAEE